LLTFATTANNSALVAPFNDLAKPALSVLLAFLDLLGFISDSSKKTTNGQ
jgi:hypothetical protein